MRRRVLPISIAAAIVGVAALSGCATAGSSSASQDCVPSFAPGALSESVSISGDSAETLRVSLSKNTPVLSSQRSVTIEAEDRDRVAVAGSVVSADLAYVDGVTGEVLEVSPTFLQGTATSLYLVTPDELFSSNLMCAAAGDVVSIVLSERDSQALNYFDGQLVLLADVTSVSETRATGKSRVLPTGFPAVTVNHEGRPGIVLPPQSAPTDPTSAIRIEGAGEPVTAEELVVGNVLSVSWDGLEQRNTWDSGVTSFGTETQTQSSFRAALTGVPVGSQVVVIEPNDSGSATVHVVDILAAV